jgi:interferon gamma-inducible protein 30
MKILAALFVVLAVATAFEVRTVEQPNDDKVYIELYYESLCPYCQQFIEGSLKTAFSTKDIWQIADFRAWPYGNARTVANGSSWSFTCQHGPNECVGNLIEACAINMYDWYTQALPFIICIEASPGNWTARY